MVNKSDRRFILNVYS